ncbi:MAG: hypothetical protein IPK07_11975 [Deltaproteobacteria bacterium]|nr:hypothetical protein [Deltaproteobacteria bacterium]
MAVALALAASARSPAHAAGATPFPDAPDPVVIAATKLGDAAGAKLGRLALMAVSDGTQLVPIPFQVDEKTADGASFVYPGGKEANPEAGNGRLDGHDELVFMASDCAAALAPSSPGEAPLWPAGVERVVEIEVKDPVEPLTGYVYLLAFADTAADPPRSTTRYVDYHPDTETVTASSYAMGYEAGKDRIYFSSVSVPPAAGGSGKSFVDRLKMRTKVETKLFFSIGFDESEWDSTVAAYLDGPVRAIREVKNTLAFVGIPVAPTIVVEATYYRDFHVAPTAIHQTVNFPSVASAAWFDAEIDLNDAARGMRYYRPRAGAAPEDAAPSAFHAIDGVPSADEKAIDPRQPPWHLVSGAPGTMLWLMELPAALVSSTDLALRDDAATPEPPESVPGTIGELVYHIDLMPLPVGDYQMRVYYFFPPRWRPGDEARWLRMTTQPLAAAARAVALSSGGPASAPPAVPAESAAPSAATPSP